MNRTIKTGIIAGMVILVGVTIFRLNRPTDNFVKEKDRQLTVEARTAFENRLTDLIKKLSEDKSDEEKYNLYLQIGYDQYTLGHLQKSRESFKEAMKLQTDNQDAYIGLFQTQVDMGDTMGALESIKKAASINPRSPEIWNRYIGFQKGIMNASDDQINNLYIEALDKSIRNIDIVTPYAQFLESINNLQGALDLWQEASERSPDNKTYEAEIVRLKKVLNQK